MGFPGWSLTELRDLTPRQRIYWQSLIKWKVESSG